MKGAELRRRLTDGPWLVSQARDVLLAARYRVSGAPFAQAYRLVRPYTMSGSARLRGLYHAVERAVREDVPGDVVECGAARGGSAALMGLALVQLGDARALWVFDTFDGLPAPAPDDPDWAIARLYTGACRAELDEVQALFARLGIQGRSRLVKGLVQETLPRCPELARIAVLHIDTDWYDGVRACLEHLYDRVSAGGIVQIDDYGHWAGARRAVDEFLHRRRLTVDLRRLDYTGRQLVKPAGR